MPNLIKSDITVFVYIKKKEEWEPINYPGIKGEKYLISNHGRVKNKITGKILKPFTDGKGNYEYISFPSEEGLKKRKNISIHRLVAWHFVKGYSTEKNEVNHKDNNPRNNYFENLERVSHTENNRYMFKQGRGKKQIERFKKLLKENHPNKNYSDEIVIEICRLINEGLSNKDISEIISYKFNISNKKRLRTYISGVRKGIYRPGLTHRYLKHF